MTIIENRDFIEGIFSTKEEAANYLKNHPDTSKCRIIECNTSVFPIYAACIGTERDIEVIFDSKTGNAEGKSAS